MIPAVSSTSAASTSTAASRQNSEDSIRSAETEGTPSSVQVDRESAVVTISQEAALQASKPTDSAAVSDNSKAAAGAAADASAASASKSTTTSADKPASNADAIAAAAASQTQSSATTAKPDWVYLAADGNKDGKVTVFEQQAYDFRHYPSSLEKAKAYNKSLEEPKVDAKVSA